MATEDCVQEVDATEAAEATFSKKGSFTTQKLQVFDVKFPSWQPNSLHWVEPSSMTCSGAPFGRPHRTDGGRSSCEDIGPLFIGCLHQSARPRQRRRVKQGQGNSTQEAPRRSVRDSNWRLG